MKGNTGRTECRVTGRDSYLHGSELPVGHLGGELHWVHALRGPQAEAAEGGGAVPGEQLGLRGHVRRLGAHDHLRECVKWEQDEVTQRAWIK